VSVFATAVFDGAVFDAQPQLAALPLHVEISQPVVPSLPLRISIVPATVLDGGQTITDGDTVAAAWKLILLVGNVDVTDSVVGSVTIEAEEDAARIADFSIHKPHGTVVTPSQFTGLPVEIWLDAADGGNAVQVFSGVVDTPELRPASGMVGLRCTDNRNGMISALDETQLYSLIDGSIIGGAYFSSVIFDSGAPMLTRTADILSTVPASLDVSPSGALRVTNWDQPYPAIYFEDDDILDGSLAYDPADRSSVINRVDVRFQYRFPRDRCEAYLIGFDPILNAMTTFGQWVKDGGQFLMRETVIDAIERSGASIASIEWIELPTHAVRIPGTDGYWLPNPAQHNLLCTGFGAVVTFDFGQEQDEEFAVSVINAASIARLGTLRMEMTGSLQGSSGDPTAAEHAQLLWKKKISGIPPRSTVPVLVGYINSADGELAEGTDRAAADNAIETLTAVARVKIIASHRRHTVTASVPANPVIDLDKAIAIDAGGIVAHGKVKRLRHQFDTDAGSAITEFSLAVSSSEGVGFAHPESWPVPDGTVAGKGKAVESVAITWNGGQGQDGVLTITFPDLDEDERQNSITTITSTVEVPFPEDLLEITL
jgi:hypothetical protein